jgi:predicted nucleic acid-binding protein
MATPPTTKPPAAVVDASVIVGFCANEPDKYTAAKAKFEDYARAGYELFAPGVAIAEVLFALCKKLKENVLDAADYADALRVFNLLMANIKPPPNGDASLIVRAEQIRASRGCSRANDALYLALAEQIMAERRAEVVTFDGNMKAHASAYVSAVNVELLSIV